MEHHIPVFASSPPPDLPRRQHGAWQLDGFAAFGQARTELIVLCVRTPPALTAPGGPLLAGLDRRLEIVFTELAGNALRHAQPPIWVRLSSTPSAWLIRVEDASPDLEPVKGTLGSEHIGGRGLAMVATVATTSGWYVRDGVKTVWAELADEAPEKLLRRLRTP